MNTGEPGQTFISAACSYIPLRIHLVSKLLLLGNKAINFEPATVFVIPNWVHTYNGSGI